MPDPSSLRLFFALWPDAALQARLQAHQQLWSWALPARPSPLPKLHLTLLFMDGVDPTQLPQLLAIGQQVARHSPAFALTLDQVAVWPHGGIAHLAPAAPPPQLSTLQRTLQQAVLEAAIPCDSRPFHPHLTLARRAAPSQAPAQFAPLRWQATQLVLAESMLGLGRYALRGSWPLAGCATT